MSRYILSVSTIFIALFACINLQAETTTVVEKKVVVTPAPKSASCTMVSAHWEGDVWVDQQSVCKYENRAEGVAWIQDYWACTTATDGNCTSWEYRPGHWVKTLP